MPTPDIVSFAPSAGPETGGTPVSITVTSISASGVTPRYVEFGDVFTADGAVSETNDTTVKAVSPANTAGGSVFITVTWSDCSSSMLATDQFVYVDAKTVTPNTGTVRGGTEVTISGTGLSQVASVLFQNTAASFTKVNDTTITAIAPAGDAGPASISLLDASQNPLTVLTTGFTYVQTPTINTLSPTSGPITGGTTVTITGSGLSQVINAQVGGTVTAVLEGGTDTQITINTPAGTAGNATVILLDENFDDVGSVPGGFTYLAGPTGTMSPTSGPVAGGTQVVFAGSGLSQVNSITFGGNKAQIAAGASDTNITVTTPSGTAGNVPVALLDSNGNTLKTVPGGFTYLNPAPVVTGISPTSGPQTGGTQVTITGTGFTGATSVAFGATNVSQFQASGDTSISVSSPPAAAVGAVSVTVTTANGTSGSNATFTYVAATQTNPGNTNQGNQNNQGNQGNQNNQGNQSNQGNQANQGNSNQGNPANPNQGNPANPNPAGATSPGGTTTPGAGNTAKPGESNTGGTGNSGGPAPGDYIPGGLAPVPGGLTGLGGTAGTGAGFGVGTLMPGGGGSAAPSNLSYYVDPALTAQLVQTLIGLVQNASSPDAIESQNIILRRMALEGDLIGSRVPPPRNISEIGGYLNMLSALREKAMREQALAGILGVAGPTQPLGWISNTQPLTMVAVTNDRPAVAAQPNFPLTVLVRSDFVGPVQSALNTLHSYGATIPLVSPSVIVLPPGGTGATIPSNILFYLGRTLMIAPTAALVNPVTDPVALIPPSGAMTDYTLASQVLSPGTFTVTPASIQAVQCTPTTQSVVTLSQASFVPIAPILGAAGFYSPSPFPAPPNSTVTTWAWLTNVTGLVAGQTELGDELSLLYRQDQIANSAFAAMLTWTWNGSAFTAS